MSRNHNTTEFRNKRAVVLWAYDNTCFHHNNCLEATHVHHLDHNSTNNDFKNLIPLCQPCHKMIHKTPKRNMLSREYVIRVFKNRLNSFLFDL